MEVSITQSVKLLDEAERIVLTAHIHPDGDALGSLLALNAFLTARGKNVRMMLDDDIPRSFRFLPGWEKIEKPGDISIAADLLVILDASDLERIGKVAAVVNAKTLNIDHHISNVKFADYWYIDSNAAATGEIILSLLKELQAEVSSEMATALFTAIATDCGFFRYANTTVTTLQYAAELVAYGARPAIISEQLDTKPRSVIESLPKVLQTLEIVDGGANGQIASLTLNKAILEGIKDDSEGFINYARNIEGVEIAILFKEADNNTVRISLRSRIVDVSKLALAFGGGGHARAAGCSVTGALDDVKNNVVQAARKAMEGVST